MKVLLFIDCALLKKFQAFSDWLQELFGITNFRLTKLVAIIIFILSAIDYLSNIVIVYYNSSIHYKNIFFFMDSVAQIIFIYWFWLVVRMCERLDDKYANGYPYANEKFFEWIRIRITYLLFSFPHSMVGILTSVILAKHQKYSEVFEVLPFSVALFLVIPCVYLLSCTPKPPTKSKIKSLLEKIGKSIDKVFTPIPEPVTIKI